MNPVCKFVLFLFITGFQAASGLAQGPFRPPAFSGRPYHPPRFILMERTDKPFLLKVTERFAFHGAVTKDTVTRLIDAHVTRIHGDSLYLDRAGCTFHEITAFRLPGYNYYFRSDSLNWKITFPPERIYQDRASYSSYLREIESRFKKVKAASRSAHAFDNFLKLNVTKLANLEIAAGYERRLEARWSFEVEAGWQFAAGDLMRDDFFMGLYPLYKYSGVNFVAGPKFYLGNIPYLQMVMIYRYLEMDEARTKFPGSGMYGLQYQYRNDLGGGFRFGIVTKFGSSGVLDAYIGGGLKVCMVNQFIYGHWGYDDSLRDFFWENEDHSATNNHITMLMPVFNAGIKVGVGF